jgi:hypothetical protein
MTDDPTPLLKRLKINTVAAPDIGLVESWYTEWLSYSVCERGEISAGLAGSWGTPGMTGRPYIVMQPESGADVFLRVVEIDEVAGYKPMTSLGWNAFEIIIDDVYKLNENRRRWTETSISFTPCRCWAQQVTCFTSHVTPYAQRIHCCPCPDLSSTGPLSSFLLVMALIKRSPITARNS